MTRPALLVGLACVLAACAATPARLPSAPASPALIPRAADPGIAIVENATAMLGQPYRYGGAAPGGFDCSGLVMFAAGRAGFELPRTAAEQLHAGMPISRRDLRAGDLVFMHLARKALHVGIAVDRDRFVHAPSAGGHVRIDSLAAAPYARGYLGARRIAGSPAPAP